MGKVTNFFGCSILRNGELVREDLWIRDGVVVDPNEVHHTADVSIDCEGGIIAPGFIDVKINGALGVLFSDPNGVTEEKLAKVRAFLPYTGVTQFCPTVVTSSPEVYPGLLSKLHKCKADPEHGAGILGVHLDGPFISKVGAHNKSLSQNFGENAAAKIEEVYGQDIENVAIVTMAPELPKSEDAIKHFTRLGIRVSIGHTMAGIETAEKAVDAGVCMVSHLFNAMPDFHHRDPGTVGLMTSDKLAGRQMYFSIISDRHHVHPAALRMVYRIAPESLMLCTDGQAPLGMGPGKYDFGGTVVEVVEDNGVSRCYKVCDQEKLQYGSVCPLHRAVRNLQEITGCTLAYALESVTKRPAQMLGLYPKKGALEVGSDADLVILEQRTLNLVATFIAGQKCADNRLVSDLENLPLACPEPDYYSPTHKKTSLPPASERLNF